MPTLNGGLGASLYHSPAFVQHHGVIDTKEYFYKIKGAKYNINATKDMREKQRQKQQEQRKADNTAREATFGHD